MKPEIKKATKEIEYIYIVCPKCGKRIEGRKDTEIIENYKRHAKACKEKK